MSDFPTRHPYALGLWQNQIERIMAAWIAELPVPIYYGREVTGFAQDDTGVDVELSDGESLRARVSRRVRRRRSLIRKAAGIEFPGWDPTRSNLIAEVEMTEEPPDGIRHDGSRHPRPRDRAGGGRTVRVVVTEQQIGPEQRAHPARPQRGAHRRLRHRLRGPQPHLDLPVHRHDAAGGGLPGGAGAAGRRRGARALPGGRQGLSLGVQDAVNLGWKLAQVVNGTSPESLLDTYHAERHPVAARVLQHTMAQTALQRRDERIKALRRRGVGAGEHGRASQAARRDASPGSTSTTTSARGTRCSGAACPIWTSPPPTARSRVFELLHDARPVLLNLGEPGGIDIAPWADRVQLVDAELRRPVGASGARRGHRSRRRADPARRIRRLGRSGSRPGPA